jgi:membrane-associated phospholipid phosphatase
MADKGIELRTNGTTFTYVAVAASTLFAVLTLLVIGQRTALIDRELILWLRTSACPWLTSTLLAVTFTSGRLAVPAVLLFAFALYRRSDVRTTSCYVVACIAAQALNAIIKHGVDRTRPHDVSPQLTAAGGLAYPSADVMLAVVIFGLGAVLLTRTFRACALGRVALGAAALFIILAAVARVYLGAHWPTDVLGGALAGIACAAFGIAAIGRKPLIPLPVVPVGAEVLAQEN